jgi:hypothetical protein
VNEFLHVQASNEALPAADSLFSGQLIAVRAPSTGWYVLAGEEGHVPYMSVILPTPQGQANFSTYKFQLIKNLSSLSGPTETANSASSAAVE